MMPPGAGKPSLGEEGTDALLCSKSRTAGDVGADGDGVIPLLALEAFVWEVVLAPCSLDEGGA